MLILTDCQRADIDRLAVAIADSFHMKPRLWIYKHGGISCIAKMPVEFTGLVQDYIDTKKEMEACLS